MRASTIHTMSRSMTAALIGASLAAGIAASARANVITDWDEKAVAIVTPMPPYPAQRWMGMVHVAMFDATNSIARRYRPYLVQLPAAPTTSKEAAAAAAAATILTTIDPKTAGEIKAAIATYLASIPDSEAKSDGVKLGEAVAAKVLEARANDGSDAPDDYRPRTTPGVYIPTPITAGSTWPSLKPFAITKASQFRPQPPIALNSETWANDFNELCDFVREAEFDWMGVFAFSDEDAAKSFALENKVDAATIAARQKALMQLQKGISKRKLRRKVGSELHVLLEGPSAELDLVWDARHEGMAPDIDGKVIITDFVGVNDATELPPPGTLATIEVIDSKDYDLIGRAIKFEPPAGAAADAPTKNLFPILTR